MAHKLAIALAALFGFVNAGGLAGQAPSLAVQNIIEQRAEISKPKALVIQEHIIVPQKHVIKVHGQREKESSSSHNNRDHHHSQSSSNSKGKSTVSVRHVKKVNIHHSHEKKDHSHEKKIQVPSVSFNKLKYVDDSKGQVYKAPHTIVTVPSVHRVEDQSHHVAINQNLGRSNCPQCDKNEKKGEKVQKKGQKQLKRYDEKLKVQIQAPIKETQVKQQKVSEVSHRETNYDKYDHLHRHDYVLLHKNVKVVNVNHHHDHDSKSDHHDHDSKSDHHDHDSRNGHHDHDQEHSHHARAKTTILKVEPTARRVIAQSAVIHHGEDPRGQKTVHEHHQGQSGDHRHHYNDNINRDSLPGQLARGELRQNTPLSVGILNIKSKKIEYNHHD